MTVWKSLVMALSCFSTVPVPRMDWEPRNMRYLMAWFPLVGAVVGAAVVLWCWLCGVAGAGPVLRAAGVALVPVAMTGGIHLDGFADVCDALASHAEPDRKRRILKDPHIGAFAVIGLTAYLLVYFGLATEVPETWRAAALVACAPVVSRCASGIATIVLPGSSGEGMLHAFRGAAGRRASLAALVAWLVAAMGAMTWLSPAACLAMVFGAVTCSAALPRFARRNFGGMSGDVAGFFLQMCELAMLACLVAAAKAVGL